MIARHKGMVYALARKYSNAAEAEDLAQEIFLKAYRSLASFRSEAKFATWLYGIGRNLGIDAFRKRARSGKTATLDEAATVADRRYDAEADCFRSDDRRLLQAAIAKLKPKLRELLILHYYREMTASDLALALELPERTVETRLYRARKRLRKILEREGA